MDFQRFFIEDDKIRIYRYICTYTQKVWDYEEYNNEDCVAIDFNNRKKKIITNFEYLAETSNIPNNTPDTFKNDFVDKHGDLEIVKIEPIDVSDIEWLDGIPIDPNVDELSYIEQLYSMGKESYEQSLIVTNDNYMTDLDYRICLLELELNE